VTSTPRRRSRSRAPDPLAVGIVLVGYFAAIAYGVVLVTQGVVQPEDSATLAADSSEYVVVVTGGGSVDGPVAASLGDVVLTVPRDGDLASLVADVRLMNPTHLVVLGGPAVVDARTVRGLDAGTTASVTRLAGEDRYATAARAAVSTFAAPVGELLVVRSDDGTDPARARAGGADVGAARCRPARQACGSSARAAGLPVLLVTRGVVPPATTAALQQLQPASLTVAGDVSGAVLQELGRHTTGDVTRVAPA
jgi:hypothetical protein